jgi:hypothetical protein
MNGRATILYGMPIILAPIQGGRLAVRGRSWAWVSAMILAATACVTPPGELRPKEADVPAPPEGVTVYDRVTVGDASPVPAATFEVSPGKVRYVGRLGMILHRAPPTAPTYQDCGRPEPVGEKQYWCFTRELFADGAPEADLATIRQRFPKLAELEIEVRPVQF